VRLEELPQPERDGHGVARLLLLELDEDLGEEGGHGLGVLELKQGAVYDGEVGLCEDPVELVLVLTDEALRQDCCQRASLDSLCRNRCACTCLS